MNKSFLSIAALLGALSVALGAFAAHKLRDLTSPDTVAIFETGVRYQFYHVFALLFVAFLSEKIHNKWMIWAGNCFIMGIVLFCGSLYVLTALAIAESAHKSRQSDACKRARRIGAKQRQSSAATLAARR